MMGVFLPAVYKGKKDQAAGHYWLVIWENQAMACTFGREAMGAPKLYGDIDNPIFIHEGQQAFYLNMDVLLSK